MARVGVGGTFQAQSRFLVVSLADRVMWTSHSTSLSLGLLCQEFRNTGITVPLL